MNNTQPTTTYSSRARLVASAAIVMFFSVASMVYAMPVSPSSGPTATPNNPPLQNFYEPLTLSGVKEGKFGVGSAVADPGTDYDFRVTGPSLFLSGLWVGSAFFDGNIYVCHLSLSGCTGAVRIHGQMTLGRDTGPNIQNVALINTRTNARVCSDAGGNLRLCIEEGGGSGTAVPGGGSGVGTIDSGAVITGGTTGGGGSDDNDG